MMSMELWRNNGYRGEAEELEAKRPSLPPHPQISLDLTQD
jgi:hypothetical protein